MIPPTLQIKSIIQTTLVSSRFEIIWHKIEIEKSLLSYQTQSFNAIEETFTANQSSDLVAAQFDLCYNELSKVFNLFSGNTQTSSDVLNKKISF